MVLAAWAGVGIAPAQALTPLAGVASVSGGGAHACALTTGGGVKCWGFNFYGEVGDGTTTTPRLTAMNVTGLGSGVSAIAAGGYHTCALTTAGGVKCWGGNWDGQLGDGTTSNRSTPVDVTGLTTGVIAIAAGESHTCALTSGGGAKCWGGNWSGQLGDGTTTSPRLTSVNVTGLASGVSAIAAGGNHTCALTTGGGVKCWGSNANGELGDSSTTQRVTAVDVTGLTSGVGAIAAGGFHTCALTTGGGVKCWGLNSNGQLGDGTSGNQKPTAVDVTGLASGVSVITAGYHFTCVLTTGGGVKCWGDNFSGQVGDGSTTNRTTPTDVTGLTSGGSAIAAGSYHACAVTSGGGVQCWGYDGDGELGNGVPPGRATAVDVAGLGSGVSAVALHWQHTCAVTSGGGVKCWGNNFEGEVGDGTSGNQRLTAVDASGLTSGVSAVAAGQSHSCALTTTGGVKCWGLNSDGQLGDGTTAQHLTAVNVAGLTSGVTAIATMYTHNCALTSGGGVKCWGANGSGQLGDGTQAQRTAPVDVAGFASGAIAIATGGGHSCALTSGGAVRCWGNNSYGQLGDGTTVRRLTAVDVQGLGSGVIAISAGSRFTCALLTGGGVKCWGYNADGELGDGTFNQRLTPVAVTGLGSGVSAISAGGYHACARTTTGGAKCWGLNDAGLVGDGTYNNRPVPVDVTALTSGVAAIAAGRLHTCAVTSAGGLKCWGSNDSGQLGDGTASRSSTPVNTLVAVPDRLAVAKINNSLPVVAGVAFGVVVESRDAGIAGTVQNATAISLSLTAGTGPLNGTPTCTIPAGATTCTANGLSLATVQSGAVLTAHRTSGDSLADGVSETFGVKVANTDANLANISLSAGTLSPVFASGTLIYTASVVSNANTITVTPTTADETATVTVNGVAVASGSASGPVTLSAGSNPISVVVTAQDGVTSKTYTVTVTYTPLTAIGSIAKVAAGEGHTCALTATGGVKCWGNNFHGQLGDGTQTQRLAPVDVAGLTSGVTAIAVGGQHTCALTAAGGVKCWGNGGNAQLGDGTYNSHFTPADVTGLGSGVSAIAAGGYHTCALTTAGGVKCWGANWTGQLGDGTFNTRTTAADVSGLASGVSAIAAGQNYACALTGGGGVKCWGENGGGQLGDGSTTQRLTAVDVTGLASGISAVAAGGDHTCALTTGGGMKCWGTNWGGQVGDSTSNQRLTAVDVTGLTSGVAAIAVGQSHTCALTTGGGMKCWGYNRYGNLGDGTSSNRATAVDVSGLTSGVSAIAAGHLHTCAVMTGGALKCWGKDNDGQLGDGVNPTRSTATDVAGLGSGVANIAAGFSHSCARTTGGGVKCWGDNSQSQLGDGTFNTRTTAVDVSGLGSGVSAVTAGGYYTCALTTGGGVKCWGANWNGQLGDGTNATRSSPVDVTGLTSGVTAIAAGNAHACALTSGGGVKCWGNNNNGQIGDGTFNQRLVAVDVTGLTSGVTAIAAGQNHTCALTAGGGVKCWGWNGYGQLGDGTTSQRSTAVDVAGLTSGVSAIAAGNTHGCARTTAGGVKCWGGNWLGQLGDGTFIQRLTAVGVAGLGSGVSGIVAGGYHNCARTTGGGAKCWGYNGNAQVGDGTYMTRVIPVDVSGLTSGVSVLSAGDQHTCAVTTGGAAKCWGNRGDGRVGDSTFPRKTTPANVVIAVPDRLAIAQINGGLPMTAAVPFSVRIESRQINLQGPVQSPTAVTLSLSSGTGSLNGTTTCNIPVGGSSCTLSGLTLTTAQSAAVLTAHRTSGDTLADGVSEAFNVAAANTNANLLNLVLSAGTLSPAFATGTMSYNASVVSNNNTITVTPTLVDPTASVKVNNVSVANGTASGPITLNAGNNTVTTVVTAQDATTTKTYTVTVNYVPLAALSSVTKVATGRYHACALTSGGGVKCWGSNGYGELGDGTTIDRIAPVDVVGLASGVTAIAAGDAHTCALTSSGGVKCWGRGWDGALGDGTWNAHLAPADVSGLTSGVAAITAGVFHSCALTTGGGVKCWGANFNGQLGDGTTNTQNSPVNVSGLTSGATTIASGYNHTCAVVTGAAKCWGNNNSGQLGDGTTSQSTVPVSVGTLTSGVAALATGGSHTCALTSAGGLKCWGANFNGQVGDGTSTSPRFTPVDVTALTSGVAAVAAGNNFTCAVTTSNGAKCWGWNGRGALGDGTFTTHFTPNDVLGLTSGATAIAASEDYACAVAGGAVKCWGAAANGQLGDGTDPNRSTAADVTGLGGGVSAIATSYAHTCALIGGAMKCWGMNNSDALGDNSYNDQAAPVSVLGLTGTMTAMATGWAHTCAVTSGGGVRCWGQNGNGQLGDGTTIGQPTAVDVSGIPSGATAVAAGNWFTCALVNGGVKCWGQNNNGQLGNGNNTQQTTPVNVAGLASGVTAIAAGYNHACAVTTGGAVKCWGWNGNGQLGDGTTFDHNTPIDVTGLGSGVAAIAAGYQHTCALTTGGGVKCWGQNNSGQLGDGTFNQRQVPTNVLGLASGVGSITLGGHHTCARTTGGAAKCWGYNGSGQLGDGSYATHAMPVGVSGLAGGVANLAAGERHTCALTTGGGVKCWGSRANGRLGDGVIPLRPTPGNVILAVPDRLAILQLNGGQPITAMVPFSALIEARQVGITGNVASPTPVNLSLTTGSGSLTGTTGCTILAGTSSCTVNGLVMTAAQSGAILTATRTGGDLLAAGTSFAFDVGIPNTNANLGGLVVIDAVTSPVFAPGTLAYSGTMLSSNNAVIVMPTVADPTATVKVNNVSVPSGSTSGMIGLSPGANTITTVVTAQDAVTAKTYTTSITYAPMTAVGGASRVVGGSGHTCELTIGGGVKCWGDNGSGQVGDGSWSRRLAAVDVSGLGSGVAAIVAGNSHSCALTTGGGVKCWGANWNGQLGDGTTFNRPTPVDVSGLTSGVAAIAAGQAHTCALTTGGAVKCWGNNNQGQLGDGTTNQQPAPVSVSGLGSGIGEVAAGGNHTCARTTGGGVKCWGENYSGQVGNNTNAMQTTPVDVTGLGSGIASIAAGNSHTCARTTGGGVKCWGENWAGQVGDGTYNQRWTPVDASGLGSGIGAIAAGANHTCARTTGGGVKCWGRNTYGQVGDYALGLYRNTPFDVPSLGSGVSAIGAGYDHSCAITTGGNVTCWGYDHYGQLGDGIDPDRPLAADVVGLGSGTASVVTGSQHSCALTAGGGVKCWGDNGPGQLGDGTNVNRITPVDVLGLGSGVTAVTAGSNHNCVLTTGSGVKCWGANWNGQLGDNTTNQRNVPVDVNGLTSGVTAIAAGDQHTCALLAGGAVKCWGGNWNGQVGDGTTTSRLVPTAIPSLASGVSAIGVGSGHGCAVTSGGGVKCWGGNWQGQLGNGTTNQQTTPVDVTGLASGVVSVDGGNDHTCARTSGSGVKCWGGNWAGQLGDGTFAQHSTPVDVQGMTGGVAAVTAGNAFTCARTTGGGARCWGQNVNGQLGDGTHNAPRTFAADVTGLTTGVSVIAAGDRHACAVTTGGAAKCWGSRADARLGDGSTAARWFPGLAGIAVPDRLAVASVNGGTPVVAGAPFSVQVESRQGGVAGAVAAPTAVSVALTSGAGPLNGTPSCTIPAGGASCSVGGLSLATAQTGAVLTAHRTAGDVLADGVSEMFNVIPGRAGTSTAITAHTPDPSLFGAPIAVTASVTVTPPGTGTPTGTIIVSDGSASCPITLPATSCNLTPTSIGAKTLIATYAGDASFNGSTSPGVGHTVSAGTLDVDGSVTATKFDALTDGLITLRYLAGMTGTSLTTGALGTTATRTDPAAIEAYLDGMHSALDIDGNSIADAQTDGLLIVRYMFGLRGNALISGAVGPLATRATAPAIEAYLRNLMP